MNMETNKTNKINEFLDRIEKPKSIHKISLDDYPLSNSYAQTIKERVNAIIYSLKELKEYIKDDEADKIIKTIWLRKISDKDKITNDLLKLELLNPIEISGEPIRKIGDIEKKEDIVLENEVEKNTVEKLKGKLEDFKTVVNNSLEAINSIWLIIKFVDNIELKENEPSIKQVYDYSSLLSQGNFFNSNDERFTPEWDSLCNKIDLFYGEKANKCCCWYIIIPILVIIVLSVLGCWKLGDKLLAIDICNNCVWIHCVFIFMCIASILATLVLLFNRFIQFQSKHCESNAKLKEKMMNAVVDAFHEDREFIRFRTKTEIALHEKLEKSRIDEWSQNKENERKLNIMEQERIAELSNVLKELAKVKNTVTFNDPKGSGKTITIERSVLSEDCCNELKEVLQGFIKEDDCCCKILKCLFGDPIDCEKLKKCLKSLLCDKENCEGKCKELLGHVDRLILAIERMSSNGASTVINNCK